MTREELVKALIAERFGPLRSVLRERPPEVVRRERERRLVSAIRRYESGVAE